jgi:predicted peroxiredoxin
MTNESRNLVVVITHGIDHELSSVGLTIARAGITAGMKVSLFLTSAGVDLVRRGAAETTHVKPIDPLGDMFRDFLGRGGVIWACPPCVKSRGYTQDSLIEGVVISGAPPMHEQIKAGAATLCF